MQALEGSADACLWFCGTTYASTSLIVARDYDVLLLHCQRQGLQRRVLGLKDGRVEAIVILRDDMFRLCNRDKEGQSATHEV